MASLSITCTYREEGFRRDRKDQVVTYAGRILIVMSVISLLTSILNTLDLYWQGNKVLPTSLVVNGTRNVLFIAMSVFFVSGAARRAPPRRVEVYVTAGTLVYLTVCIGFKAVGFIFLSGIEKGKWSVTGVQDGAGLPVTATRDPFSAVVGVLYRSESFRVEMTAIANHTKRLLVYKEGGNFGPGAPQVWTRRPDVRGPSTKILQIGPPFTKMYLRRAA